LDAVPFLARRFSADFARMVSDKFGFIKAPLAFYRPAWYRNSMKLKSTKLKYLALAALTILAVSCISTGPVEIPDDLSPADLIQRGQEKKKKNRYNISIQYYEAIIERFSYDIDNIIAAEYEIAFINYKQKNYIQAKAEFNRLLARYNTPDQELLPAQFKILSNIVLEKIKTMEADRQK
jgi:tetratricopeptide (TPR) repeat protein